MFLAEGEHFRNPVDRTADGGPEIAEQASSGATPQ
jgi:hypothetical protein